MEVTMNNEFMNALLEAQKELMHVPETGTNPHFGSSYATLEGTWEYVKPAFNGRGIYIQQVAHPRDDGVAVETVFHGYGSSLSGGEVFVKAQKQDPQGFGSALTYARRYSLSLACGVGGDDDDDGNRAMDNHNRQTKGAPATKKVKATTNSLGDKKPLPAPSLDPLKYTVMTGGSVVCEFDSATKFYGYCRQYISNPDNVAHVAMYKDTKESILSAVSNSEGETKEGLEEISRNFLKAGEA
jgi:hypothetical protein